MGPLYFRISHSSVQPKSKPPTPTVRSTIRSGDSSNSATDHLVNLWGPSASDSHKPLSNSNLNRRFLSQRIKNSSLPKAASRTTVSESDLLRELVFVLNGVGGNLIKFNHIQDSFRVCLMPFCRKKVSSFLGKYVYILRRD
ncbi:unnamed protein product [Schistosoma curassoni]|uniref:Flocculation protein FLO11-like n=1 Tax=Schistosoma curassoni TaxID=6186 RepID=A0A183KMP3_9TREM|nr:unnamed protein product [Schistosoma curassoni]